MMNHDIFISYSSKQKSIADGVCHYLEENGFKCWMAPRDIPVGSEYGDLIEEAIKTSKVVVLVFSQAASISKWVKGEINVAFTEDKPILPFRVDETEIKGGFKVMLNQTHWIDAYPYYADWLPNLLNSICSLLGESVNKVKKQFGHLEKQSTTINLHESVDLGLPSGTQWATCNLGASKPEEYGEYFTWGETQPKPEYNYGTYKFYRLKKRFFSKKYLLIKYCCRSSCGYNHFSDSLTVLQTADDAATCNWGVEWRTPTKEQWEELLQYTKSIWTTKNGVNGRLFTANNGRSIFLPSAGGRWDFGVINSGSLGAYWSSSLYLNDPHLAWGLGFPSDRCFLDSGSRCCGSSLRPVRSSK